MFEKKDTEAIGMLLRRLEEYPWKDQHKKRKDIGKFLGLMVAIDKLTDELNKNSPFAVKTMEEIDPEAIKYFFHAVFHIIERIMEYMKIEDPEIIRLGIDLRAGNLDRKKLYNETESVEKDEITEEGFSKQIDPWIERVASAAKKAAKKTRLRELDELYDLLIETSLCLKKLERDIEREMRAVERVKYRYERRLSGVGV